MELISAKKKKSVPVAEKQASEVSKPEAPVPTAVPEEPQVTVEAPKEEPKASAPSIMDILQTTDSKMLQTAQQLGIPLRPLMEWAVGMEAQVKAQSEALETLGVKLTPLINLAERAQQAQASGGAGGHGGSQEVAPPGAGGLGAILQLLPTILGSGGGESEFMKTWQEAMMKKALEREDLGNAILKGILEGVVPKVVKATLTPAS